MATIEHLSSDSLGRTRATVRTGPARLAWLCVLPWLLAACATTAGPRPRAYAPPVAVTAGTILQQPALPPLVELDYLARAKTPAALLRRAWLELLVRRPQAALDSAAQVLYGPFPPSANDESFARYLRAEAWTQLGKAERGQYDRERAAELAMDVELRRLLLADSAPTEARAPKLASLDLALQDRATWKARAVVRKELKPMTPITRLTIHHSAMYFRDTRPAACAAQILRIQHEHMQGRGYGDIGYHFLIDPSGRIWKGRGLEWQGAHAEGENNVGNVGICLLGNFLRGRNGQGPTAAQVESMQRLVVGLMRKYRIDAEAIYCHKDLKPTECPGPLMVPVVNQLVRELQRHGTARFADLAAGL